MSEGFIGERLRQLRLINEKSLQDVGNAISTTKQYIQQLEANLQKPTEITKMALADYFGVSKNFFIQEYNTIYETECYFRKAKSTPVNVKEKAQQYAALLEEYITFLDEDEFDLPQISFLSNEIDYQNISPLDIEQLAEKLRTEWNLGIDTPIDNMTKALENAGAVVTYFTELSDKVDAFSINRKRPLVIRNNEKYNGCRLRFDLAHECGHLVLHKGADNAEDIELKEDQANRFASAFLLPRKGFCQEFFSVFSGVNINWQKMLELKKRWKVSFAAMIHRAYDLNLIDAIKYRNAYIYLRKSGQSKVEHGDNFIELEKASLLENMTKCLIDNDIEELVSFIQAKGWSANLFEKILTFDVSQIESYMAKQKNIIDIKYYL